MISEASDHRNFNAYMFSFSYITSMITKSFVLIVRVLFTEDQPQPSPAMRRHAGSVFHLVSEGRNTIMAGGPRYILAADPEGFTDVKRSAILSDGR